MLSSLFTNASIFIFLFVTISEIKNIYTHNAVDDDKIVAFRKLFDDLTTNTSSKVPCYLLTSPMDRIKSALKDLEIYNELYCSSKDNTQPVGSMRETSTVDARIDHDAEASTEYNNSPENIIYNQEPVGQRTIYYPLNYNRWINPPNNYPNNYAYPYNDPSYQGPAYYYPNGMPYMPIYPVSPPSALPPTPQAAPFIEENVDNNSVTPENSADTSSTTVLGDAAIRKNKKFDRRCSRRKSSRRMDPDQKQDDNDDSNNSNDNSSDMNNNDSSMST